MKSPQQAVQRQRKVRWLEEKTIGATAAQGKSSRILTKEWGYKKDTTEKKYAGKKMDEMCGAIANENRRRGKPVIGSQLLHQALRIRFRIEGNLTKTLMVNGGGSCRRTKGIDASAKVENLL
jgi:hypothetical protein